MGILLIGIYPQKKNWLASLISENNYLHKHGSNRCLVHLAELGVLHSVLWENYCVAGHLNLDPLPFIRGRRGKPAAFDQFERSEVFQLSNT